MAGETRGGAGPTRRMALGGAVLATGVATAGSVAAQPATGLRAVDALFAQYDRRDGPGMAVGVFRGDQPVHIGCYGMANLEQGRPITPDSVFHIASVSKHFTGVCIALLAREGRVDLDADLRAYLPQTTKFAQPIRVRHLLHHTSGLRDQWQLFELTGRDLQGVVRQRQMLELIAAQRDLNFPPGSDYSYSNSGYTLLGEIVRVASGQTLSAFCAERLFKPLGMTSTFVDDRIQTVIPGRVESYETSGKGWGRSLLNYEAWGPANICTTLNDMGRWAGQFCDPRVGDRALLDQIGASATLDDGTPLNYGFGLQRRRFRSHDCVLHLGSDAGFRTAFVHFPRERLTLVLFSNVKFDRSEVIEGIVDVVLDGQSTRRPDPPLLATPSRLLDAAPGAYLAPQSQMVTIIRSGSDLVWKTRGGPQTLMFTADGGFHLGEPQETRYRFVPAGDPMGGPAEAIEEISQVAIGKVRHHQRVTAPPPRPAAALQDLAGRYRIAELQTDYDVTVEGSTLVARTFLGQYPLVFTPTSTDRFDSLQGGLTLAVRRGGDGRVTGAELSSSRCRAIRMDRTMVTT